MSETALAVLNQYPRDKFNVLAPETLTTVTPWHQVTVSVVKIDPAIPQGEKSNGQVYVSKGKLALHKESLQRLADAAGIRFRPTTLHRFDDGSFQADVIAEKQDPDGTWRQFPGSYYWNVPERVASVRDPQSDKGKEDIRMIRTFSAQRAETGAISRAIRCILPIKQAYTPKELANPFIVARVVFNPWQDPVVAAAVRQALAVKLAYNTGLLHGPEDGDPLGIESGPAAPAVGASQVAAADEILALVGGQPTGSNTTTAGMPWGDLGESEDEGEPEPELEGVDYEAPPNVPTEPAKFFGFVNEATNHYYTNMHHLLNTLKIKTWPYPGSAEQYAGFYKTAVQHAAERRAEDAAKSATQPALIGEG